jgi:hypothetical protein
MSPACAADPDAKSALTISIFRSVGMKAFSFWKPSLGDPTSQTVIRVPSGTAAVGGDAWSPWDSLPRLRLRRASLPSPVVADARVQQIGRFGKAAAPFGRPERRPADSRAPPPRKMTPVPGDGQALQMPDGSLHPATEVLLGGETYDLSNNHNREAGGTGHARRSP